MSADEVVGWGLVIGGVGTLVVLFLCLTFGDK